MPRCPHCDEAHEEGVDFCPRTGKPIVDIVDRMTGRVIAGKYKLLRAIGQGGMGTIFEAEHTMIGNRVAVKLLHQPFAERREPVQRLYREARATGAVGHPNIIKVHDVGETSDGVPFLVMELLKGESLGERIDREGPQTLGFVFEVGGQLMSALQAAHRAGIIHRDLKSDNVFLLADEGGAIDIKILDFGISKFISPEMENLKLTQTGSVLGTPYYMSPEQASGKKDLDHRMDIYSAGVILYEALVGTIPHTASNYNALLIEILTEDVKPFRWLRPDVPEALERTILKALSREKEDRWRDALDFHDALSEARRGFEEEVLWRTPVVRRDLSIADRDSKTMDINDVSLEELGDVPMAFETGDKTSWRKLVGTRRGRAAWIGGGISTAVLAVALAMIWGLRPAAGEGEGEAVGGPLESAAAALGTVAPDDAGVGEDVSTVRLSVTREPADATITVDGILVPLEGMELARTGITMRLEASAPGYEPKVLDIVPTVDLDLDIALEKSKSEVSKSEKDGSRAGGRKASGGKAGGGKTSGGKAGGEKAGGEKAGGEKANSNKTDGDSLDRPMDNPF
jgi:serine/threonine protein kinase